MRPETLDDEIGGVFRRSYQAVVDQAPVPLEPPPTLDLVPNTAGAPPRAFRAGAIVAAGILLAALGLVMLRPGGPLFAPASIPPLSHPLTAGAERIDYNQLPTDELRQLVAPTDLLWSLEAGERRLFLAARPGRPPLLFGTACSILTSVDLPEDWEGLCLEMTIEGRRMIGLFAYDEAVAAN